MQKIIYELAEGGVGLFDRARDFSDIRNRITLGNKV